MVLRHCAIFLVTLFLILPTGYLDQAHAELLAKRFVNTDPPQQLPMITFEDAQGRVIDLNDFKGQFVLLNLWATWCGPCVHEMPALDLLSAHFSPSLLRVIALTEDHDGLVAARSFYKRHELKNLAIFIDPTGHVPSALHSPGIPITVLINPNGLEVGRVEGEADWAAPEAIAFLTNYIKQNK